MATDTSQLLYLCPFCPRAFRTESDCRDHISEEDDGAHHGRNGYDLDHTVEVKHPDIDEKPIEGWQDTVATALTESYEGEIEVPYEEIAEAHDLPESFVAHELVYTHDREPIDGGGQRLKGKVNMKWGDLTDKQQDTLLAWAYFPEETHSDLADMPLSGHNHQGSVSSTIRAHGWMFSHPNTGTPIEPRPDTPEVGNETTEDDMGDLLDAITDDPEPEEGEEPDIWQEANETDRRLLGEGEAAKGSVDEEFYKWLLHEARIGGVAATALIMDGYESKDDLRKATIDELEEVDNIGEKRAARITHLVHGTEPEEESGGRSSGDEPRGKRAEDPVPEATDDEVEESVSDEGDEEVDVVSVSDMDLGFEAMCALIETDRYDEARKLFEKVVA